MITPIEKMAQAARKEVTISGWDGGEITVTLKRPGLMALAYGGRIPNPLMAAANALFSADQKALGKLSTEEIAKTMMLIAKEALVEPDMQQLNDSGLELTDTQLNEIYSYVIGGAAALERFRAIQRRTAGRNVHDDELPGESADVDR